MVEYLVTGLPVPSDLDKDSIMFHGWMEDILNNFGKDMWECYQVQHLTSHVRLFLKREVVERTTISQKQKVLAAVADNDYLIELGGKAIHNKLEELRDARVSKDQHGSGLVIRERDGDKSSVIRLKPEEALRIAIIAMAENLNENRTAAGDKYKCPKCGGERTVQRI